MKTDLARSRARKARRVEKAAENAAITALSINHETGGINGEDRGDGILRPYGSKSTAKAPPRRLKRKKSPSLSKLKKLLWTEISGLVRSWSLTCLVPGCGRWTECAAHIVPANDGAATRFFLPNLYPCCWSHNFDERQHRGSWVYRHQEMFGEDFVSALYAFSETTFQVKKHWVLEQTERVKKLRLGS